MALMNRDGVVDWIMKEEGGVADVGDGAGLTRWGQTEGWLLEYALPAPNSPSQAKANYLSWLDLARIGPVIDASTLVGLVTADFAINSGASVAIKALQAVLGVKVDAQVGPVTLGALGASWAVQTAILVLSARQERNGGLITAHPDHFARWAHNWASRYGRQFRLLARATQTMV